jgi:peptidyl-prolyl cis-trans isomerase SurA
MRIALLLVPLAFMLPACAQNQSISAENQALTIVDRVVAVVNRQAILESDIEDEIQLSILDPSTSGQKEMSPQQALDRLISRALIQQQIRQEDLPATVPDSKRITESVAEIRNDLPACVRAGCRTDAGWMAFLALHELTPDRVQIYMRNRLEILSFIEMRFRQGIRIAPEEIEKYYRDTLLPQYPAGETPPPLDQVSSRIEEILLQQQVNVLFDTWLANLRSQGQIEVLDPSLEASNSGTREGATKE